MIKISFHFFYHILISLVDRTNRIKFEQLIRLFIQAITSQYVQKVESSLVHSKSMQVVLPEENRLACATT